MVTVSSSLSRRVETQVSRRSLRRVSSSESSGSGSFLGVVAVVVGTGVLVFSVDLGAMVDNDEIYGDGID